MDYAEIASSIAETIEKASDKALTENQKLALAGAVSVWLDNAVKSAMAQTLGWAYGDACIALDKGEDYRKKEVPELLERMRHDLCQIDYQ